MPDKYKTYNITGLWKKTSKSGTTYYNGSIRADNVLEFMNELKKLSDHGEVAYINLFQNKASTTDNNKPNLNLTLQALKGDTESFDPSIVDDDIPF